MDLKERNKWTLNYKRKILFYFRRGGSGCTVIYNVRSRGDTLSLRLCAIAVNLAAKRFCFLV